MTPIEIESMTYAELWNGPFPYPDCSWLQRHAGASADLVPDLDMYFADIVGFASSASRLNKCDPAQMVKCLPALRKSFFELFPTHEPLANKINETDTPQLARQLHFAELIRAELLPLLEAQISPA